MPHWMMQSLQLREGGKALLTSEPKALAATFARFQPLSEDFLQLAARLGPKALMEDALRAYCTLTRGCEIAVQHDGMHHRLRVLEVAPDGGRGVVSLTGDVDVEVDFALPPGALPDLKRKWGGKQQVNGLLADNVYKRNQSKETSCWYAAMSAAVACAVIGYQLTCTICSVYCLV